ncbi:MAG: DUF1931 domain-containing protein [Candidatus Aenigmarchaeota archaeon]|nr:DUF1931 domain-containing protein [Candidatus Aenigmarchaeota archaeon]MDW8149733.1 DUF1931 domain-containing protein [Candidatus Aenigmarchaeota archaeon]
MALVVKSAVRELIKEYRVSEEFFGALEKKVEAIVKEAMNRAKANNRKTLRAADL